MFRDINDQINCEEQTNFDDYSMNLFDDYKQIIGTYTIELNKYNSRKVYAHMDETCDSLAPDYERTDGC